MSIKSSLKDLKKICKQARKLLKAINTEEVVLRPRIDVPNEAFIYPHESMGQCFGGIKRSDYKEIHKPILHGLPTNITNPSCQEYM